MVATIAGEPVAAHELDAYLGNRLLRIATDQYTAERRALDEYLESRLLAREADRRHVAVTELLRLEVVAKTAPVTREEAQIALEVTPERYTGLSEEDAIAVAADDMSSRRAAIRKNAFIKSLRDEYPIQILLAPPRAAMHFEPAPMSGPPSAMINIVEFSDFQCPYCLQLSKTLATIRREYGDRVSVSFKHFPLAMHGTTARRAAEASICAARQQRFWPIHDLLFADPTLAKDAPLVLAARGELNPEAFRACMGSSLPGQEWRRDYKEGLAAGVTSTPTLFINGRMAVGAKGIEALREIIDDELRLKDAKVSLPPPINPTDMPQQ